MRASPDYDELIDHIKKRLKATDTLNIVFTTHLGIRENERQIKKEDISQYFSDPKNLVHAEKQGDEYKEGEKYRLWFRVSGKYNHVIVIKFIGNKVKIITMYCQNKKKVQIIEKSMKMMKK